MSHPEVLITSIHFDLTTDKVIDWIHSMKKPFIRLNEDVYISEIRIGSDFDVEIDVAGETINLDKIKSYWYRRGMLSLIARDVKGDNSHIFKRHLTEEYGVLVDFLEKKLMTGKYLSKPTDGRLNKIEILSMAKSLGINVPDTYVVTKKSQVKEQIDRYGAIILKPVSEVFDEIEENWRLTTYTKSIGKKDLETLPDTFAHTLIQNEIKKKYEIRSFYLQDYFYSMAIFSQDDNQTKTDFRKYNFTKPNRTVPYKLPKNIEDRLRRLMKMNNLRTGSIDLIYTTKGDFVFLEINPIGQFGMVSDPCNYNLYKLVAEYFCK